MSKPSPSAFLRRLLPSKGGCLLALLVLMAALGIFALLYRPPAAVSAGGSAAAGGADAADLPLKRPAIRAVAVSPDGSLVAYGGENREGERHPIDLRRIADGRFVDREAPLRRLAGHEGPVMGLRFGADGTSLFSCGLEGRVMRWRLDAADAPPEVFEPPRPAGGPTGLLTLELSPDGRLLAAAGWSGDIFVWDLVTGGEPVRLAAAGDGPNDEPPVGHVEEVRALAFVAGKPGRLFSAGGDGLLIAWDLAARRALRVVGLDGKTPTLKDVRMRLIMDGPDREGAILALTSSPPRGGLLFADYRSCVYQVGLAPPCDEWWSGSPSAAAARAGGAAPAGVAAPASAAAPATRPPTAAPAAAAKPAPPPACFKPLLDRKAFCAPLERPVTSGSAAFWALMDDPVRPGAILGIGLNAAFRILRPGDTLPWREFRGAMPRTDRVNGVAFDAPRRIVVTGSREGNLNVYRILGDASSPEITPSDQL